MMKWSQCICSILLAFTACSDITMPSDAGAHSLVVLSRGGDNRHLYLLDVDHGTVEPLLQLNHSVTDFRWLDFGNKVVYGRQPYNDTSYISVYDRRTGMTTVLTYEIGLEVGQLTMSPSKQYLAYVLYISSAEFQIVVIRSDGTGKRIITTQPTRKYDLRWSPNEDGLVYVADTCLWRVGIQGQAPERLTHDDVEAITDPCYSSDGAHIIYSVIVDVGGFGWYGSGLMIMNADGTEGRPLTSIDTVRYQFSPVCSWTSGRIAFLQQNFTFSSDPIGQHVYLIPESEGEARMISSGEGGCSNPNWLVDGVSLVYKINNPRGGDLYLNSADNPSERRITFFEGSSEGGVGRYDVTLSEY